MKDRLKKPIALLLALVMSFSLLSPYAWAAELEAEPEEIETVTEDEAEEPAPSVEDNTVEEEETEEVTEADTISDEEEIEVTEETEQLDGDEAITEEPADAISEIDDGDEDNTPDTFDNDPEILDVEEVEYEEVVTSPAMDASSITSYSQYDSRWANHPYGYKDAARTTPATIGSSGCGILSYTNAVYYLNGSFIEPTMLADWSVNNGHRENGVGTKTSLYKAFANAKGSQYNIAFDSSVSGYANLKAKLNKGYVAICSKEGHIMCIGDYDNSSGKYLLIDSSPSSARGTSNGYGWRTQAQLEAIPLRTTFYIIKSTVKPATPVITLKADSTTQITISWTAVAGAVKYRVEYNDGDGAPYVALKTVNADTTSFTHKNLEVAHRYGYRVYAIAADGTESDKQAEAHKINTLCPTPEMTDWYATGPSSVPSVIIKWKAATGAKSYEIHRNTYVNGPYEYYATVDSSTRSFTDTGVSPGNEYGYRVYAINKDGAKSAKPDSYYKVVVPTIPKHALDVRCVLDGAETTWCGTFDVYVSNNLVANDVSSYRADLDEGTTFVINDVKAQDGCQISDPQIIWQGNYSGFISSGDSIIRVGFSTLPPNKHAIDLNRLLDGTEHWELAECATADIWVNGTLVADDVSDYWAEWPEGSTYEVTDVKTKTGYRFDGIQSGSMSGVVGGSDVDLRLVFSTVYHQFDLNGTRDGNYIYSLEDCATVDVYLNGNLVADDVIDYCENLQEGTTYEFRDLKVKPGYKFEGIVEGSESGTLGSYTVVNFAFSTKYEASPGTQVIPDGWYMIVTGNDDDWVLDLNSWSGENGANLELYHRNNTTNQRFYLHYLNNGFYSIQVLHSGKYIQKASEDINCNVHQWAGCESYGAQWKITQDKDGYFFLEARNGGYLDNQDNRVAEDNNIQTYYFNGCDAQRWRFVSTSDKNGGEQLIPDGWYVFESGTDSGYALDVAGSSMDNGGTLCLWYNDLSAKQIFHVEYQGDGYYAMRSKLNGKYIRTIAFDEWSTDGWCEDVAQWEGIDKHSRWCLESTGDGYYYVRFENGNYLDHYGSSAYPLSTVVAWMFNGGQTQKWKITPYNDSMLQPGLTSHYMGHTYEVFYQGRTWSEADAICRARGGHLATITSEAENQFLTERLVSECTYWLGGTDRDSEGTFTWTTGEGFTFSNWSDGEPNNTNGIEHFITIFGNGQWNDEPEGHIRDFICEYDPAPPVKTETYQNHVYEVYNTAMSWDEAKAFCEAKGGHLTTITSQGENDFVHGLIDEGWIGANDIDNEGSFVWITGEPFDYSNWQDGEPNNALEGEDAVAIRADGKWNDWDAPRLLSFICEYDPDKTNIDTCTITLSETSFTYDGNAKTPAVTVKRNNDTLTEGVHYTVSYQNNINAGTATVTITGKGDYVGSIEKPFTITKPAEPDPQPVDPDVVFQAGSAAGSPGAEITIPVSLTKNSGIAGFTLDAVYDHSVLTLKSAAAAEGVGGMFSTNGDLVNWYADENVTFTGMLFNLTFTISGTAASGDTEISLAMHSGMPNVVDENSDNVATEFKAGAITVRSYVAGDVTGDGFVTIADVVKINRHVIGKIQLTGSALLAADVTGDGNVTIADVVKVNRYVIGKIQSLDAAPKRALMRFSAKAALGALTGPIVAVDSANVEPGAIVEIPIKISNNTGFAGFAFELTLPQDVKLNSVKVGSTLTGGLLSTNGNIISWYTGDNVTNNGDLLILNVTAPAKGGDYSISVALKGGIASNFTDENSNPIAVTFEAGTLHVESTVCEHEWDEGTETTPATCTEAGVKTFTCSKCGETRTEDIPAKGHNYQDEVTAPTCTSQGYTTHTCDRCDDSYTDTYTDIAAHDYQATVIAPTCTTEGYTQYVCSHCGDSYEDHFVSELDHDYDDGVVTTQATEDTDGEILYTCNRCGATKTEVLYATGHEYDDGAVTKEPTCTEDGVYTYTCLNCGETVTEPIEALGHEYSDVVTAPTCTERGYTTHTCGRCNDSYQDTFTDALGHSWNSGIVTREATCTDHGVKTFTCSRCNDTRTEDIPAKGHSYKSVVTAPTCTERGYTTHTCERCNDSYQDTFTDALGHSWNNGEVTKSATTTEEGIKTFTCTRCKATRTEAIPKLKAVELKAENITIAEGTYVYSGKEQKPAVTVTGNGQKLTPGTDYTVSYENNINAGNASVTVTGIGGYTGTVTGTFTIKKANQNVTVSGKTAMNVGTTQTLKASGKGTISYVSNNVKIATVNTKGVVTAKAAGTVKITVTAAGDKNHNKASKVLTITVKKYATPKITKVENVIGGVKLTLKLTAGAARHRILYKIGKGGWQKLTDTTASTYTWKGAKNGTTYSFTVCCVSADGKLYTSDYGKNGVSITYVASPALTSVKNTKAKTATVAWSKLAGVNGFQIQYSTSNTFKSGNKTVNVKKGTAVSQVITGLSKGKTYYFRIRSYKTVSGKLVYSAWSAAKALKITK